MKSTARSGFTLVEVIIVLLIIAVIMGTAVMSVGAGLKSARVRDAARAVQLYARHAKAVALLKQRPVVLTFEEVNENGAFAKSRVSISFSGDASGGGPGIGMARGGGSDGLTRTISGQVVGGVAPDGEPDAAPAAVADDGKDPLMAEPREFPGVRIVARSREEETAARPRISVFSNVDVLLKKRSDETARAREREAERRGTAVGDDGDGTREEEDRESSFSVVYEANGRCEPFNVSVFRDGADERDGLNIAIGRFGRPVTGD